jgi:hypothetical protein
MSTHAAQLGHLQQSVCKLSTWHATCAKVRQTSRTLAQLQCSGAASLPLYMYYTHGHSFVPTCSTDVMLSMQAGPYSSAPLLRGSAVKQNATCIATKAFAAALIS